MAFKGFSNSSGSRRPRLSAWRGGEANEIRLYINHPHTEAKIWFVRGDDGDWVLKKWDEGEDQYPGDALRHPTYSPSEFMAVNTLDELFGPLSDEPDELAVEIGDILDRAEAKFKKKEGAPVDEDGIVTQDPDPNDLL